MIGALCASAPAVGAQAFAERPLPAANAVSKDEFHGWPLLRELTDGSVVIVDQAKPRIVRVNFSTGKTDDVVREGPEDNELRASGAPWGWRADSVVLLDAVKGRLMILAPDGSLARTQPFGAGARPGGSAPAGAVGGGGGRGFGGGGGGRGIPQPRYLVSAEHFFIEGAPAPSPALPPGASPPRLPLPIYRMGIAARSRDSLAQFLPLARPRTPQASTTTGTRVYYVAANPLFPADVWAAYDDGGIAVVRSSGYRIDFIAVNGERLRSDSIPYPEIAVTDKDRKRVVKSFKDSTADVLRVSADRVQTASVVYEDPTSWPTVHPPFRGDVTPVVGPGDLLWLPVRCTSTEDAQCYDVIDRNAKRVARWQLPDETYIVGFGKGVVYTWNKQKRGKEHVQRHPLPQ